jgi:hypothetical protein
MVLYLVRMARVSDDEILRGWAEKMFMLIEDTPRSGVEYLAGAMDEMLACEKEARDGS